MGNSDLKDIEKLLISDEVKKAEKAMEDVEISRLPPSLQPQYYYLLAKINFELGKDDAVMPALDRVLQCQESSSYWNKAHFLAGSYFVAKADGLEPGTTKDDLMNNAHAHHDKVDQSVLSSKELALLYYERAQIEQHFGRIQNSIPYFELALQHYDSAEDQNALYEYLAEAYNETEQHEKSIKYYDSAIKQTPSTKAREIALLSIGKARVLDTIGRMDDANMLIFKVLDKYDIGKEKEDLEISMYCYEILGHTFHRLKDFRPSLRYYSKALELAEKNGRDRTSYLFDVSRTYRALNDFENAEKRAKEALDIATDDDYIQLIYEELFWQCQYSEKYEKAKDVLKTLIRTYPDYEDLGWAYVKIGHMESLLANYDNAIRYFERSLTVLEEEDELHITAQDFMAFCYLKSDQINKAMTICLDIIEKHPDGPNLAWTHAVLARCYFEKGMKIQAQDEAEKAQKHKAPTAEVYSYAEDVLADILRDLGIQ